MKKIMALLAVAFMLSAALYSQALQYDIKVKYLHEDTGVSADITVTVKSGEPDFSFFLMTNDPVKGTVLQQSGPSRKKNYVFRDVKPGKYFIKIHDQSGMPFGKTVVIDENEASTN